MRSPRATALRRVTGGDVILRLLAAPVVTAVGRALNAAFFVATSLYAVLTYSPFAYEQFIQPHMVAWVSNFVILHADFYWLALCVTVWLRWRARVPA